VVISFAFAMVHCVELCSDVYQVCLTHALSTEKEEVMGLLMGEVTTSSTLIWLMSDDTMTRLWGCPN
jgi:hypothetical protein